MSEQQEPTAPEPSFREVAETAQVIDEKAVSDFLERDVTAPPPEPEAPAPEQEEQPKFVPLGALHEERQKRKNAEALARQREQDYAQWQRQAEERLSYLQQLAAQQQPKRQIPSFEEDPLTNIGATVQAVGHEVLTLKEQLQRERESGAQMQAVDRFVGAVTNHEQNFASQRPDYYEAINWAKSRKASEYVAAGSPEAQAWNRVQSEAAELAARAVYQGESPAEVGYRLAQAIGWQAPKSSGAQRLEMQKSGRAAATPSGGSGQGGGRLSVDALIKMSGDDFLKATSGDNWKKLMGRQ